MNKVIFGVLISVPLVGLAVFFTAKNADKIIDKKIDKIVDDLTEL